MAVFGVETGGKKYFELESQEVYVEPKGIVYGREIEENTATRDNGNGQSY